MAIYHLHAKIISRATGRSAVAAAAYRSASRLHDVRLERAHDFTKKRGVVHSEILLPPRSPIRLSDRLTLWNEVEALEKRKDAQLAREVEFSIPREMTQAQGIALARDFVREQFVERSMVADLNVHWDIGEDGQAKPHAHVMLTTRSVDENGFGAKERTWNDKDLLLTWREQWATLANERLAELDLEVRIDHRSFAAQGIDLEPQNKIGPAGMRREERGEDAERVADHLEIARRNGERLLAEPHVALEALTRQQSTFTRQDLARFVDRHTADAEQFASVLARVEAYQLEQGARGLVRYWDGLIADYEATLPGMDQDPSYDVALDRLRDFGWAVRVRARPEVVETLRRQGKDFGLEDRPVLKNMLADAQPERVLEVWIAQREDGRRQELEKAARIVREKEARDLVHQWDKVVEAYNDALPGLDLEADYRVARDRLLGFGQDLKRRPDLMEVLRQRGEIFGMEERPGLRRAVAHGQPEQVIAERIGQVESEQRAARLPPVSAVYSVAALRRDHQFSDRLEELSLTLSHRDRNGQRNRPQADALRMMLEAERIPHEIRGHHLILTLVALAALGAEMAARIVRVVKEAWQDANRRTDIERKNDRGMGR